jgi:hypothetical protein
MSNPFEDLRQAVVVRPMNSPGPQGAAAPHMKVKYSADGTSWHNDPVETDRYLSFSTDNGITWSDAIYFNNLSETLDWVEKARQWAENPENDEVEPGQYSALHHALQAKKAEITAEEYAIDAAESAVEAFGAAAPAWDNETVYNYNDVVSFDNGHTYRCIGTDIVGADHAPNIDGVDNVEEWTRITVSPDGYFEVDENGDLMPMITPITSEIFMLDENGDIMHQEPIDAEIAESYGRLEFVNSLDDFRSSSFVSTTKYVWLDGLTGPGSFGSGLYWRDNLSTEEDDGYNVIVDNDGIRWKRFDSGDSGNTEIFVNSIDDLRTSSFLPITEYIYVAGYYGAGTPGGGLFYRDAESSEPDNSGTIIVDNDGIRWKRANVHEEYYASWFGVSPDVDDNSPLIQNALNVIPSSSILIFGPGEYKCEQPITIPDNPESSDYVKYITLQGSSKLPTGNGQETWLRYTGSIPATLTPFFDFRGSTQQKFFNGSIRNIFFTGRGEDSNIVGLWFYKCSQSLFDSVMIGSCKHGIQIDDYYYYCKFYDVRIQYCDIAFKSNNSANHAAFYYCNFKTSNVGMDLTSAGSGVSLNACYLEANRTAIKLSDSKWLRINQCYFEKSKEYAIDIHTTDPVGKALLTIEGSTFANLAWVNELISDVAIIRLTLATGDTVSCVFNNNEVLDHNSIYDYLIYVESGDVVIKAENNMLPAGVFPICSKPPLDTSYFNNDFSE